ncbi:hypothetical protein [Methanobacterium sp. SMA-27]|uniref:hypothetical protein n=1 Tax=Methanobacterium sp. SMA-27 TaxID=1495336 RepID=UPI00064EF21D|nr:hypothetical protein [Methanobacterium sp. SMA-27]
MQDKNNLNININETISNLKKVKGESLLSFETNDIKGVKQFKLKFKALNEKDKINEVILQADNITFVKHNNVLENVFTAVDVKKIVGKRFLEYEDWHAESLTDTGNITAPQYNLTLTFEEGYVMEIENYR